MSIQSEITRISGNIADSLAAVAEKGVTVPAGSTSDDLAGLIAQISGGGVIVSETPDTHGGTKIEITAEVLKLQAKTVSPSESQQIVEPDTAQEYNGLSAVTVNAISPTYVGSGVARESSSDLTVSGGTVTAPAGYYASSASKSVASGTEGTPTATKGTVSNHSVSVTPSVTNTAGYISGSTKTGTAVTVTASELASGNKSITANGTNIDVVGYSTVSVAVPASGTDTSDATLNSNGQLLSGVTAYSKGTKYTGSIATKTASDLTASGATVTVPSGYYASQATKSVASGTVTAPASITGSSATVSTGTNTLTLTKTVSVTPSVSTAGYVSSGTAGNSSVSLTASVTTQAAQTIHPSTSDQTIAASSYLTGAQTIKAVTMSNLTADNIKSGVVVNIGDSTDADCVASVTGTYSGGGGSVSVDTKTVTASNYPTSISFTSMKGEPKMFAVRLNAQVSSSGNTTYYYIVDIIHAGTTTNGNCFRIGSTRRVDNITSGYSYTYSGTTLTITSSAASRSASPGAFYSGSYELIYVY